MPLAQLLSWNHATVPDSTRSTCIQFVFIMNPVTVYTSGLYTLMWDLIEKQQQQQKK